MKKILGFITAIWLLGNVSPAYAADSQNPVIAKPQFGSDPIRLGETTEVLVDAHSPAGSALTYVWSAVSGTIQGEGDRAFYTAPKTYPIAGLDTVTVVVRDARGRVSSNSNVVYISNKPAGASLRFEPERQTLKVGQNGSVKVWMDTGGEMVDKVELLVDYSREAMEIKSVSFMPLYAENHRQELRGDQLYISMDGDAYTGEGSLVEINFAALKTGSYKMGFENLAGDLDDTNLLLSSDELVDLLYETEEAAITINPGDEIKDPVVIKPQPQPKPQPVTTPDTGPGIMMLILIVTSIAAYAIGRRGIFYEKQDE